MSGSGPVIILGNLTVDLVATANIPAADVAAQLAAGENAFLDVAMAPRVGGSAPLFARALQAGARNTPVIAGTVGDDAFGRVVFEWLRAEGFTDRAVETTSRAPTAVIAMTYFDDGPRMLMASSCTANDELDPGRVADLISAQGRAPALLWVSGYALRRPDSLRHAATLDLAARARDAGVPIALDLVPHDFARDVGALDAVLAALGRVDAVVAEARTVTALGLAPTDGPRTEAAIRLWEATGAFAIVQSRIVPGRYGQAVAGDGAVSEDVLEYSGTERGIGDRLAVKALLGAGLLEGA